MATPDVDFVYGDADTPVNEIAELYSYTEQSEHQLNVQAFEDIMQEFKLRPSWQNLGEGEKVLVVMKLLDLLEVSSKAIRMKAARCFLYIAQGCWVEVQSDQEQEAVAQANVMVLYDCGVFLAFVDLLNIEMENSSAASAALRKPSVSLADSMDLRVVMSVLYVMVEGMRATKDARRESFRAELGSVGPDGDMLAVKLLNMITRFCSGSAPHFPIKKVLLLLWKVILTSLGGMDDLRELKGKYREQAGLGASREDTVEVSRHMRASSPPASAADILEAQSQKKRPFRRSLQKQSVLDEGMVLDFGPPDPGDEDMEEELPQPPSPRPASPVPVARGKGLPWAPKVRLKDLDQFLDNSRIKFVGFQLEGDRESLAGLPQPIHEGVHVLKQHIYTSLAEIQIQREEEIARNPISNPEGDVPQTPTEILYQAMLPNLPQHMIALLKLLLAAAPTSKARTDSMNILADVLPEEMPMTVLQSMRLGVDVNRHKEIIVKAVSAILFLLLKYFKLNHIYQFEFMSQNLVFANCIPLVLKFFNQNIMSYAEAKNSIPILDFPACVIGDAPELTSDSMEIGENQQTICWRNMFSCINLLRVLNKLTKWKHSRIMMLVVFKSAPILKRSLNVRHAMMQVYVLKLLKMQTKYLGRQWRKSNMKTISAIYQKVRHRLNDDWAFGNDMDARPWDFQAEESSLRASVDRFNNRRYSATAMEPGFEPVDNCVSSVLGQPVVLSDDFKQHYEVWLQQEVFLTSHDWSQLLQGQ